MKVKVKILKMGITILIILFSMGICTVNAQAAMEDRQMLEVYRHIPQEGLYIHPNASLLLAGEPIYYSTYCLDLKSMGLSEFSKMAYILLIGEDGKAVFRHKVPLHGGMGSGDFFIGSTIATGNYKLIGYTQWMKNGGPHHFFQSDIRIINPYLPIPEKYLEIHPGDSLLSDSTTARNRKPNAFRPPPSQSGRQYVSMNVAGAKFSNRDKVTLHVRGLGTGGNYSLSVRKRDSIEHPEQPRAHDYRSNFLKAARQIRRDVDQTVFIPELRGELISGKVVSKEDRTGRAGKKVALSLPGRDFIVDIAHTNKEGVYYFNIDRRYENTLGILQLLDENKGAFEIVPHKHQTPDFNGLQWKPFSIGEDLQQLILERSIHNQIENAYASVKSDTVLAPESGIPFYRDFQETYILDDYTRFNTIKETIVEIVDHVWIKNNATGAPVFQVRPFDLYLENNALLPMVFVDGMFIQNHQDIMDLSSKRIRTMYLSRDRYLVGSAVYQGILAMETFTGDFYENFYRDFLVNVPLFKPESMKKYYRQQYTANDRDTRIPDFRYQLLWEPHINLETKEKIIAFYTSDITGDFEICLEGFTETGQAVSIRETIRVE